MTVYLGTLGRMIPIYSTPSAQLDAEERYSFSTTLEGRRKAQARPIGRRTWGLSAQFADPSEHSALSAFANGAWGIGPFIFVPVDAPHTNLLTPAASTCMETTFSTAKPGGPVNLGADGWAASSLTTPIEDPNGMYFGDASELIPVTPGQPVTGSAWVQGIGARVRLNWYDMNGNYLSSFVASTSTATSTMSRLSVVGTPPSGAAACRLLIVGPAGMRATRPAVTWSNGVQPWSDGQGCKKAVVSTFSRDQVLAVIGNTYSNVSFTVTEVG